MESEKVRNISNLFAKMFIARTDVRAKQLQLTDRSVIYKPDTYRNPEGTLTRRAWDRQALDTHQSGNHTYGHYFLSKQNECKLFAFDIDLLDTGSYPYPWNSTDSSSLSEDTEVPICEIKEFNPRLAWKNRKHESREWTKVQLRMLAGQFTRAIWEELNIHTCAAYSGNKGIHVYGFTGLVDAADARLGAEVVLDKLDLFVPYKGKSFFRAKNTDTHNGYPNFSVELFPKQTCLGNSDNGLGNLMRLPLGRNLQSPREPTFFIDLTSPMNQLKPVDPVFALTTSNPWLSPPQYTELSASA